MASIPHFSDWVTKADLAVLGSQLATKSDVANAEAAIINAITSLTTLIKTNHTATDALFKPLATSANVAAAQAAITQEITTMSGTVQSQLDAITAQLGTIDTTLETAVTAIEAEIASLQAANPTVDFTGVNAAVAKLQTDVSAAAAIPPAAPPAP